MDARGASALLRASEPAQCVAGADGLRWLLDPVLLDSALQMQVLWARLQWDVTLLPAEIGAYVKLGEPTSGRAGAPRAADPAGEQPAAVPRRPLVLRRRRAPAGAPARRRRRRHAGAEPARGSQGVMRDAGRATGVAIVGMACLFPGAARPRRLLAQHPRQGRRDLGPAAGGVGPRRLLRPRVRGPGPHLLQARRLPRRRWRASSRSRTASRRSRSAASPTSGWRCRSRSDALADAGASELLARGPRPHGGHPRQGHLPQRRQRDRGAARPRRRPDARPAAPARPRRTEERARAAARRAAAACCRRSVPRPSPA